MMVDHSQWLLVEWWIVGHQQTIALGWIDWRPRQFLPPTSTTGYFHRYSPVTWQIGILTAENHLYMVLWSSTEWGSPNALRHIVLHFFFHGFVHVLQMEPQPRGGNSAQAEPPWGLPAAESLSKSKFTQRNMWIRSSEGKQTTKIR